MTIGTVEMELLTGRRNQAGTGWVTFFQIVAGLNIAGGAVLLVLAVGMGIPAVSELTIPMIAGGLTLLGLAGIVAGHFQRQDSAALQRMALLDELRGMRGEIHSLKTPPTVKVRCPQCESAVDFYPGTQFKCSECGHSKAKKAG